MSRLTLVVNPTAGRGRARTSLPFVINKLVSKGRERFEVIQTEGVGETEDALGKVVASAVDGDSVAVMGGDGMMHLGVNACANTPVTLGLIPAGTGNDMCRAFGLPYASPVHGAKVVMAGHTRQVDLVRVDSADQTQRHIGSVLATGFDALVNKRANEMSWPKGNLRYTVAAIAELAVFQPLDYEMTIDGEPESLKAMLIAVGNGAYFGGGMKICPRADTADGMLDLTIIHPVNRATLLTLLPQMFSGRFASHPCVEQRQARSVELRGGSGLVMGDGEELPGGASTATTVPGALTIFAEPTA